jgi:hypothetical protein
MLTGVEPRAQEGNTERRFDDMRLLRGYLIAVVSLAGCSRVQLQSPIAPAAAPPPTFIRSTSETKTTRVIDVRDGLTKATAFRAASDLLSQRYTIDVSDSRAGFLMSPWQSTFARQGVPDPRYRTRVIVRFLGDDWKQVAVRAEANWQRDDEWDAGYDVQLLEEATAELRARLGKR